MKIRIAHSPDSDDAFMFYGLASGKVPSNGFELEHVPTLPVDVVRRWPSVEKARRLLGWEARIGVEDGIAATVAWLSQRVTASPAVAVGDVSS